MHTLVHLYRVIALELFLVLIDLKLLCTCSYLKITMNNYSFITARLSSGKRICGLRPKLLEILLFLLKSCKFMQMFLILYVWPEFLRYVYFMLESLGFLQIKFC